MVFSHRFRWEWRFLWKINCGNIDLSYIRYLLYINFHDVVFQEYREYWNFAYQTSTPVNFVINPGDKLNVHCVYDTSKQFRNVIFGQESQNEMCMAFLFYYPFTEVSPIEFFVSLLQYSWIFTDLLKNWSLWKLEKIIYVVTWEG